MSQTGYDLDHEEEVTNKVSRPKKYNAVLLNDDYTPFNFVTELLMEIFNKTMEQSEQIAYTVHREGQCVVGTYSKEICSTKVDKANLISKKSGYPLRMNMEEA